MQKKYEQDARTRAQSLLSQSASFREMEPSEQLSMYKDLVEAECKALAEADEKQNEDNLTTQQSVSSAMRASDQIRDNRHLNQRIGRATGEMAADFIQDVDFPDFVQDLLSGVFDANLGVTIKQMEQYQQLLKSATKSLSSYVQGVNDEDAFAYLAENMSDQFSFMQDDDGEASLADASGQKLDIGDNEVRARVMDAKLALAQEQRALLRETILMGISRLVVERGTVKAAVVFDVKAGEKIVKSDKASDSSTSKTGGTRSQSRARWLDYWAGPSSSTHSGSNKSSKISVSSAKSTATTDLAAQITGSVEIVFKSDYFRLDNFASMYGGTAATNRQETQQQPSTQQPQGQFIPG